MMRSIALVSILQLLASFVAQTQASSSEKAKHAGSNQVVMTSGGTLVRREAEEGAEQRSVRAGDSSLAEDLQYPVTPAPGHTIVVDNLYGMFAALDLNGDHAITTEELKAKANAKHVHYEALLQFNAKYSKNGRTTFEEFKTAVIEAAAKSKHRHVHKHEQKGDEEQHIYYTKDALLAIDSRQDPSDGDPPSILTTTCGGHKAVSCEACPTTNSDGQTVADHGSEWCNGDCVYNPADSTCHVKGTVTVSGTAATLGHGTTALPDLLNPNMTKKDEQVINAAAEAAIREENFEAAAKQKQEEEEIEKGKFTTGKVLLYVIVAFSVILGICALVSMVALCIFCFAGTPGAADGKDVDDEGEGLAAAGLSGEEAEVVAEVAAAADES